MNIIEALRGKIVEDGEACFADLPNHVEGWPEVPVTDGDPSDMEPLDLENVEVIKMDESELVIWGGGDWQDPRTVTIRMDGDDMRVVSHVDGGHYGDHNFLDLEDVEERIISED